MSASVKTKDKHGTPPVLEERALVTAPQNAMQTYDYGSDAGAGMEDVSQSEMLIPFMRIVQPTGNILKESHPSYNEHAKQGMILNTAAGALYPRATGFGFIPCFREASYTEWVPVDAGGGFRGTWDHEDPRVAVLLKEQGEFKSLKTPDGTELVETRTMYGVAVPRDAEGKWLIEEAQAAVVAFTSTQIKKYRTLVTRLNALIGKPPRFPMFAWRWNVTTVPESNKKGDYYGWQMLLDGESSAQALLRPNDPLYLLAKDVHHLIKAGGAKADFAQSEVNAEPSGGSSGGGGSGTTIDANAESDIPF